MMASSKNIYIWPCKRLNLMCTILFGHTFLAITQPISINFAGKIRRLLSRVAKLKTAPSLKGRPSTPFFAPTFSFSSPPQTLSFALFPHFPSFLGSVTYFKIDQIYKDYYIYLGLMFRYLQNFNLGLNFEIDFPLFHPNFTLFFAPSEKFKCLATLLIS